MLRKLRFASSIALLMLVSTAPASARGIRRSRASAAGHWLQRAYHHQTTQTVLRTTLTLAGAAAFVEGYQMAGHDPGALAAGLLVGGANAVLASMHKRVDPLGGAALSGLLGGAAVLCGTAISDFKDSHPIATAVGGLVSATGVAAVTVTNGLAAVRSWWDR